MYKILELAQNVGRECMRQMFVANVCGKCWRQMYAANVDSKILAENDGGKAVRNCEITVPHNIRQIQGGR